ncbi:MAG: hypothetical protein RR347_09215 [Anaerovoracaceae bacterium]
MNKFHKSINWIIFDVVLVVLATISHLILQLFLIDGLKYSLFDSLLLVATIFLIVKMHCFYCELKNNSDAFYFHLYGDENALKNRENDVAKIFHNGKLKWFGCIYGALVGVIMFFVNMNNLLFTPNLCLSGYLAFMNYFTGEAIAKLFQYFKTSKRWINNISFSVPSYDNSEIAYIRKIRNKVLFIAIIYCFFSQMSIIFSPIHINLVVYLYTGCAVFLVLSIVIRSEVQISNLRKRFFDNNMNKFNCKISEFYSDIIAKDLSTNTDDMERLRILIELKEHFVTNYNAKFNINVFISAVGFIITAILPVLLQIFFL